MATRSSALREAPARSRPPASPSRHKQQKPALGVVDRRRLLDRARRRQARALVVISGVTIAAAMSIAAGGHALLATDQIQADGLQSQVSAALSTEQNLQLQRAQLETPSRILSFAKHDLRMVSPTGVTYLTPVNPGKSVSAAEAGGSVALPGKGKGTPASAGTDASKSRSSSSSAAH